MSVHILSLRPYAPMPSELRARSFKAIVVIESDVATDWRNQVCDWLIESGCLYMMAWGGHCSEWDDAVDSAFVRAQIEGRVGQADAPMTTWHDSQSLAEVFEFAKTWATYSMQGIELRETLIVHIANNAREEELLRAFAEA